MKLHPACSHSTSRVLGAARACVLHPLSSCFREDIRMPVKIYACPDLAESCLGSGTVGSWT